MPGLISLTACIISGFPAIRQSCCENRDKALRRSLFKSSFETSITDASLLLIGFEPAKPMPCTSYPLPIRYSARGAVILLSILSINILRITHQWGTVLKICRAFRPSFTRGGQFSGFTAGRDSSQKSPISRPLPASCLVPVLLRIEHGNPIAYNYATNIPFAVYLIFKKCKYVSESRGRTR